LYITDINLPCSLEHLYYHILLEHIRIIRARNVKPESHKQKYISAVILGYNVSITLILTVDYPQITAYNTTFRICPVFFWRIPDDTNLNNVP
jgi:hypothetical protein